MARATVVITAHLVRGPAEDPTISAGGAGRADISVTSPSVGRQHEVLQLHCREVLVGDLGHLGSGLGV